MTDVAVEPRSARRVRLRRPAAAARGHRSVIAIIWIVIAIFAPLIAPYDPLTQSLTPLRRRRRFTICSAPTSSAATSSAA